MKNKKKTILDVLLGLLVLGGVLSVLWFVSSHGFLEDHPRVKSQPAKEAGQETLVSNVGTPRVVSVLSQGDGEKISNLSAGNLMIIRIHNPKILKTATTPAPKLQKISDLIRVYPDAVIMNTSGFDMNTGELLGLQINNGQQLTNWHANSQATHALTVDSQGQFHLYDNQTTGAQMIKAGVLQSYSFGQALIQEGKVKKNNGTVNWMIHTFIGYDKAKNLYLVVSKTFTPYEDIINGLAPYHLEGLILQDGGGSSQLAVNHEIIFASQDDRAVVDYIVVR